MVYCPIRVTAWNPFGVTRMDALFLMDVESLLNGWPCLKQDAPRAHPDAVFLTYIQLMD